jgi:hypothetical protein
LYKIIDFFVDFSDELLKVSGTFLKPKSCPDYGLRTKKAVELEFEPNTCSKTAKIPVGAD